MYIYLISALITGIFLYFSEFFIKEKKKIPKIIICTFFSLYLQLFLIFLYQALDMELVRIISILTFQDFIR